jgi:hypothetical protein
MNAERILNIWQASGRSLTKLESEVSGCRGIRLKNNKRQRGELTEKTICKIAERLNLSGDLLIFVCLNIPSELMPGEQQEFRRLQNIAMQLLMCDLDLKYEIDFLEKINISDDIHQWDI